MTITEKGNIGDLELKNRMIMAPVKTAFGEPGGKITEKQIRFYDRISSGGISMIILEPVAVLKNGREHPKQLTLNEENIETIGRIIDIVHKNGSYVAAHINHAGRAANPKLTERVVAPSKMECKTTGAIANEMSIDEIKEMIKAFGESTKRAKELGFDAIEVQFGHGYIISQFFSERTNKRRDEYGGNIEHRMRFALEVAEEVLKNKGNMSVIGRISGNEFLPDGLTPENQNELLKRIVNMGFDAIHVGWGNACDNPPWYYNHMALNQQVQFENLKEIRNIIDVPLIVVGRMSQKENFERVFNEDLADFISMGRQLIIDPDFPKKLVENRESDIKYCGACLQGCLVNVKNGTGIGCVVNPFIGEPPIERAEKKKKVVVVGGGPAGLIASIVLRKRGHDVTLYEKETEIGGQFYLASLPPSKRMMKKPLVGLLREAEGEGVKIKSGINVNRKKLMDDNPDSVVIATGAIPRIIEFKGIDKYWYITGNEALLRNDIKGKRVLVIGGGMIGLEVAEKLCEDGNNVTIVEILPELARDMEPITKSLILKKLSGMDFEYHVNTGISEFTDDGVIVKKAGNNEENIGKFDLVVFTVGTQPDNLLYNEIKKDFKEVVLVGDAATPSNAYKATKMAYDLTKDI